MCTVAPGCCRGLIGVAGCCAATADAQTITIAMRLFRIGVLTFTLTSCSQILSYVTIVTRQFKSVRAAVRRRVAVVRRLCHVPIAVVTAPGKGARCLGASGRAGGGGVDDHRRLPQAPRWNLVRPDRSHAVVTDRNN